MRFAVRGIGDAVSARPWTAGGLWRDGRGILRAPWRLVLFSSLAAALGTATLRAFPGSERAPRAPGSSPAIDILSREVLSGYAVLLGSVFLAGAILARFVERRPVGGIGLGFHSRWKREIALGFLLGALFITAVTGTLAAAGWVGMARSGVSGASWARGLPAQFVLFLEVALLEELLFRGYPLQVLSEGVGKPAAAILLSVLFGLVHAENPGGNAAAAVATGCAGLLLSVAYFRTRSLWLPVGIHFGWNFFLGSVFSFPVSGEALPNTYFITKLSGPERMTGGAFGPEAGLPAFAAMGILAAYLGFSRSIFPAPEALSWYPRPGERTARAEADEKTEDAIRGNEGEGDV